MTKTRNRLASALSPRTRTKLERLAAALPPALPARLGDDPELAGYLIEQERQREDIADGEELAATY